MNIFTVLISALLGCFFLPIIKYSIANHLAKVQAERKRKAARKTEADQQIKGLAKKRQRERDMYLYNHLQDRQIMYGHEMPLDIAEDYAFTWLERQIENGWLGLNIHCDKDWTYPLDDNIKLEIDKEIFPLNPDVITINVINIPNDAIIDTIYLNWYIKGDGVRFNKRGNNEIKKYFAIPELDKAITRLIQLYGKDEGTYQILIDSPIEDLIRLYSKKLRNHDTWVNNIKRELEALPDIKTNILFLNNNKPFKKGQIPIIKRCFFNEDIGIKEFDINNGDVVFEKI